MSALYGKTVEQVADLPDDGSLQFFADKLCTWCSHDCSPCGKDVGREDLGFVIDMMEEASSCSHPGLLQAGLVKITDALVVRSNLYRRNVLDAYLDVIADGLVAARDSGTLIELLEAMATRIADVRNSVVGYDNNAYDNNAYDCYRRTIADKLSKVASEHPGFVDRSRGATQFHDRFDFIVGDAK